MLRPLKGPDLFIDALAEMARRNGVAPTAVVVGAGEQKDELVQQGRDPHSRQRRLPRSACRSAQALPLAKVMVLPSRADSLPYVVLEAVAANRAVVAVDVGGVREIVPPELQPLVRPCDAAALAAAMAERIRLPLGNPEPLMRHIRERFAVAKMANDTMAAYLRAGEHCRKPVVRSRPAPVAGRLDEAVPEVPTVRAKKS